MQARERLTTSLWGSAYCVCLGIQVIRVHHDGSRATFTLDDTDGKATEALQAWWEDDPQVGGRSLVTARSILLDRITNTRQHRGETENADSTAAN